jgi:hypothetical protein
MGDASPFRSVSFGELARAAIVEGLRPNAYAAPR